MTVALEPALAALAGSMIGGLTTLAVTLMTQRVQARAALTTRDLTVRQKLYRKFIEEASKLYGDALMHSAVDIPMLIGTSALVNRMRVISTSGIVDKAEVVLRTIVDIYFSPNKTIAELHEEINRNKLDLLRDFSNAAREELSALRTELHEAARAQARDWEDRLSRLTLIRMPRWASVGLFLLLLAATGGLGWTSAAYHWLR